MNGEWRDQVQLFHLGLDAVNRYIFDAITGNVNRIFDDGRYKWSKILFKKKIQKSSTKT